MDRFLQTIIPEVKSLTANGRTSEAIYALEKTISWSLVQLALIWCNNHENLDKAEQYLREAIKVAPGSWEFHLNLAHVLNLAFKFDEAKVEIAKSVQLGGNLYEPLYNQGVILSNLLDHEGAIKAYREAAKAFVGRDGNLASYNLSSSLLLLGRWKEGWAAYEQRFRAFSKIKSIHDRFRMHYRPGDPTKGKTIYVYSEQGVGDLIQFARYLPKLKALTGAKIVLESQASCAKLMSDNFKLHAVVPRENGSWPEIDPYLDYALSVCSLPHLFEAGIEPIPNEPYIKAPERALPAIVTDKLKVGLCWAGNSDHPNDYRRSMHLSKFSLLSDLKNVQLYSLQKDATAPRMWRGRYVNLLAGAATNTIVDLSSHLDNFSDTAHLIGQMDLVITVDTSIVHLAGAMGKPCWLLIDKLNDWRWGTEGETCEWYPSVRIFRQDQLFDWVSVMERVAKELTSFQNQPQDQKQSPSCGRKGLSKQCSRKRLA